MLKFLRRVFIVLILLLVVFVVYRFINPDGANRLVDKIKSIPTSIGIVSKNKIKLKGETTSITGDVQKELVDENEEYDFGRLESLNKEIEEILGKKDKSELHVDEDVLIDIDTKTGDLVVVDVDENLEPIAYTGVDIISEDETSGGQGNTGKVLNVDEKKEIIPSKTTTKKPRSLSDLDYQQIVNVFGNLFK
ncbi:MAG TPA: hypothetical protein PKX34_03080 [Candidatus Absconditabacterales bacterium]|nr:hypothetical protein [Candidatus Absconditabacterales bacterium]